MNAMEALLWILLPGFVAIASALLAWFVTQSRMEVKLAEQRETIAETRGALRAEREAMEVSLRSAVKAAEESAKRQAFDLFHAEHVDIEPSSGCQILHNDRHMIDGFHANGGRKTHDVVLTEKIRCTD